MLNRLRRLRRRAVAARAARSRNPLAGVGPSEIEELLALARESFLQVQAAWDRADLAAMGGVATTTLLADLRHQLAMRGPGPNHTEVIQLDARLLALEDLHEALVASVEFSGLIREHDAAVATPFRELWLLAQVKSVDDGWKLARVQSLC